MSDIDFLIDAADSLVADAAHLGVDAVIEDAGGRGSHVADGRGT